MGKGDLRGFEMSENRVENIIIVGGACAGYTAALYTARADLEPLVIEGFRWGGQLQNTTHVENYPGYPEGIMGPEMMQEFRDQAERFRARFITDDATRVELTDGEIQRVWVGDDEYLAKAVILAMGAEPKRIDVPGEMELAGKGVSTCGVCDGAFFKGEKVVVVGGGDDGGVWRPQCRAMAALLPRADGKRRGRSGRAGAPLACGCADGANGSRVEAHREEAGPVSVPAAPARCVEPYPPARPRPSRRAGTTGPWPWREPCTCR